MKKEKKISSAIVSHKNCPDGAAAVLFARLICPQTSCFFSNHTDINDLIIRVVKNISPHGKLWITDICCDFDVLQEAFKILKPKHVALRIYEHHITRQWLKDLTLPAGIDFKVIFNLEQCGSKIFFDAHLKDHPELKQYRDFVQIINDRDLWINKDRRGTLVAGLHNIYDDKLFVERMLENPTLKLTEKERFLLEYQERKDEKHLLFLLDTVQIRTDENGFRYGMIYGNGTSSELLERALRERELEYAMLINLNAKRAHIRSRGNFDCAEFAVQRGGGGHSCAAGFPVEFEFPSI